MIVHAAQNLLLGQGNAGLADALRSALASDAVV
jgi:hypothetical protein